jgi:hypothetical protein
MRKFGIVMVLLGAGFFFHFAGKMDEYPALPTGLSVEEAWRYPQGRYQVGQWAAGFAGVLGFILAMFPKGR